ncbi:hypothetical protein PVT01_000090700 [Plasmodium vivax]|uniref:VIR protein n=1 Tax=Plasmodium vivax TaxID=5855 RepID=A0A1G4ECY0_PLAVI|nr:hypothetical protein PVT01_000090700 [Plasmodium vivax]
MSEKEPDYSFFDNFESCYKVEGEKDKASILIGDEKYCKGTQFPYDNGNHVEDICLDMVKIYNSAIFNGVIIRSQLTQNKVPEFINYWINSRLTHAGFKDDEKAQICPQFNTITRNFDPQELLKNKIYPIKEKDVKGMNILYEFYKNFYELEDKGNGYLQKFLENFKNSYNNGLIKCFNGADVKFCHELNKYIKFYEQYKKTKLSQTCNNNNQCPSLSELSLLLSSKNKLLNIAEYGYKLIGSLHISSLDGLYSMKNDDYANLKILISLQYNLLMENDDDEKYCVMMRILKQYLQFFQNNKNNPDLQLFFHEFIDKYYKAKESEYQNIFKSCGSYNNKTKMHCKIYKECKDDFNDDMSLLKADLKNYIKNKDEYFKSFGPNQSLLDKALALFQDSKTMSKY